MAFPVFRSAMELALLKPDKIDTIDSETMYLGYADSGSPADADENWMIIKVYTPETGEGYMYYADGSQKFNKKWSERITGGYTYKVKY